MSNTHTLELSSEELTKLQDILETYLGEFCETPSDVFNIDYAQNLRGRVNFLRSVRMGELVGGDPTMDGCVA